MSLTLDSSITKIVTKSGIEITKVVRKSDGAVLWQACTPYYVVFTDYPLTVTTLIGEVRTAETLSTGYRLRTKRSSDENQFGQVVASVTLPTKGCNKVDVKYACTTVNGASINDSTVTIGDFTEESSGTCTFDCSGDNFTLTMRIVDQTAHYTAELMISEIHFYS